MKIDLKEFSRRRRKFMEAMEDNSIAILPSAAVVQRNNDVDYIFRQDSDFYYLSGFNEAESVLVIVPGRAHGEVLLFCQERDPQLEQWYGNITGPDRALQLYGMDDAFPIEDIDDILPELMEGKSKLYYALGAHKEFDGQIISWANSIGRDGRSGTKPPGQFVHLGQIAHELRLFKSKQELTLLREAARITALGHKRLMATVAPGMYEYQLEAELNYTFTAQGARFHAYPPIVGSGENACIMHYSDNRQRIKKGDLILVDAGCEYQYYASDVTRTIPATGKFSRVQKQLYTIVLAAQEAAIDAVQPGNHWDQPHNAAVRVITAGLVELGLLSGEVDALIADGAYKTFYMHRTGHWMGLDVHDVGDYRIGGEPRIFEPGMITTIEPGLYISQALQEEPSAHKEPSAASVLQKYLGIGIRIEDDVLVTATGNDVLTRAIPKTIHEIESYMQRHNPHIEKASSHV